MSDRFRALSNMCYLGIHENGNAGCNGWRAASEDGNEHWECECSCHEGKATE